jgi:hypothetical protein
VCDLFRTDTTVDDYAKFPFVLACYSETLRLFPPVQMIPKIASQDVSITVQASNVMKSPNMESPSNRPSLSTANPRWSSSASTLIPDTATLEKTTKNANVPTEPENEAIPHTTFVIKKGTIIFIDPPGVRE